MEKLEAVQKVLRFSTGVRKWCESEHSLFFDDFDEENVADEGTIIGDVADLIIEKGLDENILDGEDVQDFE
ncbi:MAG: hypothetical protein G3M78_13315 [Candidatus Nitrohelix vancouverensis]|uniref:Uncharacterized protein n=1 Tax=Candidatus Nitrohelix vancouverensis TaxID=2705534 RepID=A0A7T0G4F9_9BACT|nr:MAG: hypothetical protein G3M78_13315 [Candidatus Nitrohelix vancouverensis]